MKKYIPLILLVIVGFLLRENRKVPLILVGRLVADRGKVTIKTAGGP